MLGLTAENWKEATVSPLLKQGEEASIALDPIKGKKLITKQIRIFRSTIQVLF